MKLKAGNEWQPELARQNCSIILQSAWSKYGTSETNKQNILKAWPLCCETLAATENWRLLGKMTKVIQKIRKNIIHVTDTWFYSFLLMVEDEEVQDRQTKYVEPEWR